MKFSSAQFETAVQVLTAVLKFDYPADGIVSRYFREHSELGQQDRAFVAEAIFGVLRRKRMLEHLTHSGPASAGLSSISSARALLLAWLARTQGLNARELAPVLRRGDDDILTAIKRASTDDLPLAVQAELPDWVVEKLSLHYSETEILALGRGLAAPAPLDLRVNTLRAKRDDVITTLAASGIAATPTPFSPYGLRIDGRPSINRLPLFLDGTIEVQDEGSQLLCALLAPTRHDFVIDFCAGAGGKTLMLGAIMHNRGRLYAFDTSAARLKKMQPRLARSGLSNLRAQVIARETDIRIKRLAGKADRVLVDAPCSGLGTLRRNPDLKWRQSPQSVAELVVKQTAILRAAAALVKPGGRLVYGTCSLLAEENEAIVEAFVAANPSFSIVDSDSVLTQQKIALQTGQYLRLTPHQHGTDGFFGAVITRER
ncbi:MAG: RsmB/NOP family class I SAM-dependent RNA methyltransferase [Burkholderiales bacterium]